MSDAMQSRIATVQTAMARHNIGALIVGPSADMLYLIGKRLPDTERFNALILPAKGDPVILVPKLQLPLVQKLDPYWKVVAWEETQKPLDAAAAILSDASARTVAVNGNFHAAFLLPLQARLPGVEFSDAAEIMGPLRLCKTAEEVALLERAAERFDAVWRDFFSTSIIGVTENAIARRLSDLAADHGFGSLAWCDVGSGPNGASPLHHGSERKVAPGDPVVIDFASTMDGYFTDTCRTPVAGEVHPDFAEIHEIVRTAHLAAQATAQPGIAAQEVDRAARRVIADAGYGEYFIHRVGHGLGIEAHEEPYMVEGSELSLAPGMVFSDEPGIYIPDRWGVRIENILVMEQDGARSLNKLGLGPVVMQ